MTKSRTKNNWQLSILIVFSILTIFLSVVLVQQNQETRKGAYFGETKVLLQPTEIKENVGDEFSVEVWVDSANGAKVDGIQTDLCFGKQISPKVGEDDDVYEAILPNNDTGFVEVPLAILEAEDGGSGCLKLAITSNKSSGLLKSGLVKVGKIIFTAKEAGSGKLSLKLDKTTVTGDNPSGGTDTYLKVSNVAGANYEIDGSNMPLPSTDDMWINYKVAYAGVKADRKCSSNWQTKLTALSGSTRKEYKNIPLTKTSGVNSRGEVIYEGSFQMPGFKEASEVAVFFKGPKHLQVKYGKGGQASVYNQAGGEISLTNVKASSPVLDFSKYPMLAGDVNGDGVINGVDFAVIKPKAADFVEVSDGGYLTEDLDGSCQVNNNDIILLVRSLNEKQDQVY